MVKTIIGGKEAAKQMSKLRNKKEHSLVKNSRNIQRLIPIMEAIIVPIVLLQITITTSKEEDLTLMEHLKM